MKPYQYRKLIETPDVADCQTEGRNQSAGGKPYAYGKSKAQTRRELKRVDKARAKREWAKQYSER